MADALEQQRQVILGQSGGPPGCRAGTARPALLSRLKLDGAKLDGAIAGIRQLAQLPDPLSQRQVHRALDEGSFSSASAFP